MIGNVRRRAVAFAALALLAVASHPRAQTAVAKLQWTQNNLTSTATLADIQGYTYTLKVDGGPAQLLTATCVAPLTCTAPLPTMASGTHTLALTATNAFGSGSTTLNGTPPANPINVTVTVSVTVP